MTSNQTINWIGVNVGWFVLAIVMAYALDPVIPPSAKSWTGGVVFGILFGGASALTITILLTR